MRRKSTLLLLIMLLLIPLLACTGVFAEDTGTYEVGNAEEFAEAVEKINQSSTADNVISLTSDITLKDAAAFNKNSTTILGNGHKLTLDDPKAALSVNSGASLTLGSADSSDTGKLTLTCSTNGNNNRSTAMITVGATGTGTLSLHDGVVLTGASTTGAKASAVDVESGLFDMAGGSITKCITASAPDDIGAAVSACGAQDRIVTFKMAGGSIEGNKSVLENGQPKGAGIVISNAEFDMTGGSITKNITGDNGLGGGIYADGASKLNIASGTISENEAYQGGGIYAAASDAGAPTIKITDSSKINSNEAVHGGGLSLWGSVTATIENSQISQNSAYQGGGIGTYISGTGAPTVNVSGTTFNKNTASYGGVVYENTKSTVSIVNSKLTNNTADYGAGIYARGSITLTGCSIDGNTADVWGGGLYLDGTEQAALSGTTISDSTAETGAGIYADASVLSAKNCTIQNNKATTSAGGVYLSGAYTSGNSAVRASKLNISEKTVITGNKTGDSTSNVYLASNSADTSTETSSVIGIIGKLADGSSVGVSVEDRDSGSAVTSGYSINITAEPTAYFSSDDSSLTLGYTSDKAELTLSSGDSSDSSDSSSDSSQTSDSTVSYSVTYKFVSGTQGETLPDSVLALLPTDSTKYSAGKTVTPSELSTKTVKTEDGGAWTFKGWDPESAVVKDRDITFTGTWEYTENAYSVNYNFTSEDGKTELPDEVRELLPVDDKNYKSGDTVTPEKPSKTTVSTSDGVWTFKGWDKSSAEIKDSNVTFTGTWSFSKGYVVTYKFVSGTEGKTLPSEVTATLPVDETVYQDGDEVEIKNPTSTDDSTSVSTQSASSISVTASDGVWTFEGWDQDGSTLVIDGEDVSVTGTWVYEGQTYKVNYKFVSGTDGKELPDDLANNATLLPTDTNTYKSGDTVTPKTPSSNKYTTANGVWTFQGWNPEKAEVEDQDITFTGTWTYEPASKISGSYQTDESSGSSVDSGSGNNSQDVSPIQKLQETVKTGLEEHPDYAAYGILAVVIILVVILLRPRKNRHGKNRY